MSEMGDDFKAVKAFQRAKKQDNKVRSTKMLDGKNINYESKNNGNHLIITADGMVIDFWPTTGLWRARGGKQGRGVKNLIKLVKGEDHAG